MNTKTAIIGFVRAIAIVALTAVLTYVGSADHLAFLSPATAALISGLAGALEAVIQAQTGRSLMGIVRA